MPASAPAASAFPMRASSEVPESARTRHPVRHKPSIRVMPSMGVPSGSWPRSRSSRATPGGMVAVVTRMPSRLRTACRWACRPTDRRVMAREVATRSWSSMIRTVGSGRVEPVVGRDRHDGAGLRSGRDPSCRRRAGARRHRRAGAERGVRSWSARADDDLGVPPGDPPLDGGGRAQSGRRGCGRGVEERRSRRPVAAGRPGGATATATGRAGQGNGATRAGRRQGADRNRAAARRPSRPTATRTRSSTVRQRAALTCRGSTGRCPVPAARGRPTTRHSSMRRRRTALGRPRGRQLLLGCSRDRLGQGGDRLSRQPPRPARWPVRRRSRRPGR